MNSDLWIKLQSDNLRFWKKNVLQAIKSDLESILIQTRQDVGIADDLVQLCHMLPFLGLP
jgi:hypothetical protein